MISVDIIGGWGAIVDFGTVGLVLLALIASFAVGGSGGNGGWFSSGDDCGDGGGGD